jgi:predicted NAD-dependent protein-ADP-ribosyltransferase YbiA (DUF1768 family)
MSLLIFNPKERPYGPLSNNYLDEITVDKVKYKSASSYIYSQLGCNSLYKRIIAQDKLKKVRDTAIVLYNKCFNNLSYFALEKACKTKYSDPDLQRELLATGDSFLVFEDSDPYLGNASGKGQNQYGKILMKVRGEIRARENRLEKERILELEKESIYKIYVAYEYLSKLIRKVKSELSEYSGKSAIDIVNEVGIDKISKEIPLGPKDEIYKLYTNNKLPEMIQTEYFSPGSLVTKLRTIYLPSFNKVLTRVVKEQVFDAYTTDLLSRNFPNVKNISLAKKQQFDKLSSKELKGLVDEVFDLYQKGKISVPETEESVRLKNVKKNVKFAFKQSDNVLVFDSGNPVFSPISQYKLFPVDGLLYPTVFHVMITSWIASLSIINSIKTAYSFTLVNKEQPVNNIQDFYSWNQVYDIFNQINNDNYYYVLTEACKKALYIKFRNPNLQELLVSTGDSRLVYEDRRDDILGIGKDRRGRNFVGVELEKMREQFKLDGVKGSIEKVKIETMFKVLEDNDLSNWIDMRIQDICRVIKVFAKYVSEKSNDIVKIDKDMCSFVINKIYKSCNLEVELDEPIPDSLLEKIKIQFLKTDKKVEFNQNCVGVIATYISSLISNLKELADDRSVSVFEQLKQTQDYFTNNPQECEGPYTEDDEQINNFILTGIQFLLDNFRIYFLGKKDYKVDTIDLITCFNIIYPSGLESVKPKYVNPSPILAGSLNLQDEDLSLVQWFMNYMTQENDKNLKNRINRLVFFCNKVEKVPSAAWD